jgi:formylglycine-generating enzyme required for sulfatase activity
MKMNWSACFILAATLIVLPVLQGRAQDSDVPTNAVPTLKELMATNSVVTNTVGIVLVKISPGLWAGKYETIQDAYQRVMQNNPSEFKDADHPVDSVSWDDAMAFCAKLTSKEKIGLPDGYSYTLPTQDQWLTLMGDASLSDAVMKLNNGNCSSTAPVGSLGANNLGLYDTRGNVMEWCLDPQDKPYRVLRGGAWDTFLSVNARPEFRWYAKPDEAKSSSGYGQSTGAKNSYGFRVILTNSPNPAPSKNTGSY